MTLALMIAVPLATALLLVILAPQLGRIGRTASAIAGAGSLVIALGAAAAVGQAFAAGKTSLVAELGPWLPIRGAAIAFAMDAGTVPLLLATLAIATLIGLYATVTLRRDPRSARFFIALDLLAASLVIVLAARDLLLLLAAWQGVGVSVYLLIAHESHRPDVALGAARAFVLARAGDAALLVGVLATLALFQTVDLEQINGRLAASAPARPADGVLAASALIVLAALVRAGQVPFHSWLPDRSRSHPAAIAATCGLATIGSAFLLIRLAAVLDPGAMLAAAGVGVVSAIVATVAAIGGRTTHERWCTVAQLGIVIAAAGLGSNSLVPLIIGSSALRSAAPLLADRRPRLTRLASAAGIAVGAVVVGSQGPAAPFLIGMAVVALLAVADAALALAGDRSAAPAPLIRAGNAVNALGMSVDAAGRTTAMAVEQGGAQVLTTIEASLVRVALRASDALDRLQRSSVWGHEALLLAAAIVIVAYWIVR